MMVNASAVFEGAIEKSLNMSYYKEIMQSVRVVDVSKDEDFQRAYTYFYRVRRCSEWRKAYFEYFEAAKSIKPTFEDVLRHIYGKTGNIEPSFSSKMLASLDPSMPIWDSIVFNHLGLKLDRKSDAETLANAVQLYDSLCAWYTDFLQTDEAKSNIRYFDFVMPSYKWMSDTKKVDFLLWGNRD